MQRLIEVAKMLGWTKEDGKASARKMIYDDLRPSLTGSDDSTRPTFMEVWGMVMASVEQMEARRLQGESNREHSREF